LKKITKGPKGRRGVRPADRKGGHMVMGLDNEEKTQKKPTKRALKERKAPGTLHIIKTASRKSS